MTTTTERPNTDVAVTRRRRPRRSVSGVSTMWRVPASDEHLDRGRMIRAVAL